MRGKSQCRRYLYEFVLSILQYGGNFANVTFRYFVLIYGNTSHFPQSVVIQCTTGRLRDIFSA